VLGSPLNALQIRPPFREFHLIDIDSERVDSLRHLIGDRECVHLYEGNCNKALLEEVFPHVQFNQYRRGLCLLDPYGLDLDWAVIKTAGQMKSIDLFLNFPVMDMNRNVLWRDPREVLASQASRMNSFWGDDSWKTIAYETSGNLFGYPEKQPNDLIARAFLQRLKDDAGFERAPDPLPMRNSRGAVVYYLFFASQKDTAENIVREIFEKYRTRGEK
jgi:three-Cys-motif partner protein